MKTYLLTASDLLTFVNAKQMLTENESIRLYHTNDDTLPISAVTYIKDIDITFIPTETPETLIFDIGVFIGEQRSNGVVSELFCGDGISIPDSLMQSLGIKKLNEKKSKRGSRAKKDEGLKSQRKPRARKEKETDAVQQEPTTPEKEVKPKRSRKAESKDVTAGDVSKPKRSSRKKSDEEVETKEVTPIETSASSPESANAFNTDIVTTFLKQMAVRGSDLKDEQYSDDALVLKLIDVFKKEESTSPGTLLPLLYDNFTEADANVIYGWVRPNSKRLHELALQY